MSLLLNMSCSDGRYVPWVSDQHKENVPEHFVANTTIYWIKENISVKKPAIQMTLHYHTAILHYNIRHGHTP
jgi:mRNA deadenylase 3'-5' endonuclease subunit Ccr4